MPESFAPVTEALLRTLGRHGNQQPLLNAVRNCGLDDLALLRAKHDRPYPVAWPEQGLSLMLACINPQEPVEQHTWGLHSFTLDANRWQGPWFKQLDQNSATPEDIVKLFAQDKDQALCTPDMACMTTAGLDGQNWSVVALFESASRKLRHITFTRMGDWVAAPVLPSQSQT